MTQLTESNNLVWPHHLLGYAATSTQARKLAKEIVTVFGDNPRTWLDYGRFEIKEERREAEGLEALCIPMSNDRFRFVIFVKDNDHPDRYNFLLAHEIAHTFFYFREANKRPHRTMLTSDWEETFCDVFASVVIKKNYKEVGLSKTKARNK